jgi:DNA-binding response OmpR family regulator
MSEQDWRGRGTILVVDDEETVRNVARLSLERSGFDVITASDGREALDVFRERAPEIAAVLLDVTMPQLSGEQVFREMRRIRPDARIVLTSGYDEQDTIAEFGEAGLAGFVHKPYLPSLLVEKIRAVLET